MANLPSLEPTTYADGDTIHANSDPRAGGGIDGWMTALDALINILGGPGNPISLTSPTLATPTITGSVALTSPTLITATVSGYSETVQNLGTIGATKTIGALGTGTVAYGTLTSSTASTITLPTFGAGQGLVLDLTQCASGTGGTYTIAAVAGQTLKWAGGTAPTATATNGKTDRLVFESSDGSNVLATFVQNF